MMRIWASALMGDLSQGGDLTTAALEGQDD